MSRTVWKVRLNGHKPCPQVHELPFGARPIHVDRDPAEALHDDYAVIGVWFEVDPDAQRVGYKLWIVGTGHEVPAGAEHIGSVVSPPFAWHVYCGASRAGEG